MTSAFFYVVVPAKFVCRIPDENASDSLRLSTRQRQVLLQIKAAFEELAKTSKPASLLTPRDSKAKTPSETSLAASLESATAASVETNLLSVKPPELVEVVLKECGVRTYSVMREEFVKPPRLVSKEMYELRKASTTPREEGVYYGATVSDAKHDMKRQIEAKAIAEYETNVDYVSYMFNVENSEVEPVSAALLARGVGAHHGFGWFNVLDAQVSHNSLQKAEPKPEESLPEDAPKGMTAGLKKIRQTIKSRLAIESVVKDVRAGGEMTFDYIIFTIVAAVIACVGVRHNHSCGPYVYTDTSSSWNHS